MNRLIVTFLLLPVGQQSSTDHEHQVPKSRPGGTPMVFVDSRSTEWQGLDRFWTQVGGQVKIRVPAGLHSPISPIENQPTVEKWLLGRALFNDAVLSSNGSVSCASCHLTKHGFADNKAFSEGIFKNKTLANSPPILNVAFHPEVFWDGRSKGLEEQVTEPVKNTLEMFDGQGDAWVNAILRVEARGYKKAFEEVFGTGPTQDGVAKAIATFERTVFSGDSIHDRAVMSMKFRNDTDLSDWDYSNAIQAVQLDTEEGSLRAVGLTTKSRYQELQRAAQEINSGRRLFTKAGCNICHSGPNFSDSKFHNLGVGELTFARFAALPIGRKDDRFIGAIKTPTLRGLANTAPYFHDGSARTIADAVQFHLDGGGANKRLSPLLRPVRLEQIERDRLVLFLLALQGREPDVLVSDPKTNP